MFTSDLMYILVVDDEPHICKLARKVLDRPNRVIVTANTVNQALKQAAKYSFDIIILDVRLPDGSGLTLLERFKGSQPDVEVIMITGYLEVANAVEAMKTGAYDYITKPFSFDRLNLVVEKAYQRVVMQREVRLLRQTKGKKHRKVIGDSPAMRHVGYLVDKVAATNAPVLVTGESGVGKDVVVNSIHHKSTRAEKQLIVKNCGAFNKDLLRSEFFGYQKGAFTGATESHDGLLALANNGSLFLDEVGELSLEVQSMLLRVLETQTYRRVGDKDERKVNIRFLFATNRDLAKGVEAGTFNEALYHRINVFRIEIAPLRERMEDVPALTDYFLGHIYLDRPPYRVSSSVMQCFMAYHWPGNVRELRNVIERGIILAENDLITTQALPLDMTQAPDAGDDGALFPTLEQQERKYILRVLAHVDNNRTLAAKILGIGRRTLYRKLEEFGNARLTFPTDPTHHPTGS